MRAEKAKETFGFEAVLCAVLVWFDKGSGGVYTLTHHECHA